MRLDCCVRSGRPDILAAQRAGRAQTYRVKTRSFPRHRGLSRARYRIALTRQGRVHSTLSGPPAAMPVRGNRRCTYALTVSYSEWIMFAIPPVGPGRTDVNGVSRISRIMRRCAGAAKPARPLRKWYFWSKQGRHASTVRTVCNVRNRRLVASFDRLRRHGSRCLNR